MTKDTTIVDRAALGLSAALMLLSIPVLGLVELITGEPYNPAPLTNEAGEVIASPAVDPTLRTGLLIAGLVVLLLWGVYRMAAPQIEAETGQRTDAELPSD